MKWNTTLYSCFVTNGGGYELDVIPPGHEEVLKLLRSGSLPNQSWVLGGAGSKVFFGQSGHVADRLGWEHPIAKDRSGRLLDYYLLYTAPKGTPLPTAADLEGLQGQVNSDLARLGNASHAARAVLRDAPAVELPEFTRPGNNPSGLWDSNVAALHAGKPATIVALGLDGTERTVRPPQTPPGTAETGHTGAQAGASTTEEAAARAEGFMARVREFEGKVPGGKWTTRGVVPALVVAGGVTWAVSHNRKKEEQAASGPEGPQK